MSEENQYILATPSEDTIGNGSEHLENGFKWYSGVFIVLNSVVGVALFNVPDVINQAGGIFPTFIYLLIISAFSIGGVLILGENVNTSQENNYFEIIFESCGKWIGVSSLFFTLMYSLGMILLLNSVTGDFFDIFIKNHVEEKNQDHFYFSREFLMSAVSIIFSVPFIFSEKIKSLSKVSLMSLCLMIYIVFLVSIEYFKIEQDQKIVKWTSQTNISKTFQHLPTLVLSIFMHVEVMQIYPKLNIRNIKQLLKISISASLFMIFYYLYIGSVVSVQFGKAVMPDFLTNYKKSIWVTIAIFIYIIKIQTSIPIFIFITKDTIESIYFKIRKFPREEEHGFKKTTRYCIAATLFISTLFITIAFSKFEFWVELVGIVSSILIFLFPGIVLYISTMKKREEYTSTKLSLRIILSIMYVIIGAVCFVLTCKNIEI